MEESETQPQPEPQAASAAQPQTQDAAQPQPQAQPQQQPQAATQPQASHHPAKKLALALLCWTACVLVNYLGSQIVAAFNLPIYLDSVGVILAGACGGYIPGVVVGYITNLVTSFSDPTSFYWCLVSVLIAVASAFWSRRGWFSSVPRVLGFIVLLAVFGGGLGSLIGWCLFGGAVGEAGEGASLASFATQLAHDFPIDLVDKAIVVGISLIVMRVLPQRVKDMFVISIWQQAPLQGKQLAAAQRAKTRSF